MPTNPTNIQDLFISLHQDAVLWKAEKLWSTATDPDDQASAMDEMVTMICAIENETKQQQYIDLVEKKLKIKSRLLKKQVKDELTRRLAKKQADIAKKKLEARYSNAEDAGLADGFNGNIHDALKYGIYEHEGVYYTKGQRGADYPVSNFTMKILYHVKTSDERAYRLIAVKNIYGFESFINMNTDDFVSLGPFKKVLARRGDYVFKGTDSDLSRLQEFLQRDEVPTIYVDTLGWHGRGKFFAWANGILPVDDDGGRFLEIDEYGIVPFNQKNYFIPALSRMYAEKEYEFVNEKKFIYRQPDKEFAFKEWSRLFYETYGPKSIAGILFYAGSLFRDIIMRQVQRYPLLCLFGPPGAGKGQMAESLMCMFGEKQDQIMLGGASTVVGFMRKFAQLSNAIVWLDEYKNNLPFKFIESFKNIYDGKGYERGKMTNDFSTESTPIRSSCILSGQDMPTIEPALFMRVILLSFEEGKFSEKQRSSFQRLKDLEAPGLSYITSDILRHRDHVEQNFKQVYHSIFRQSLQEITSAEVDDRMIVNTSLLLSFMHLFKDRLQFPFGYNEAKSFLIDNTIYQHNILQGNSDIAKFWQVVESLFHQDIIQEGKDFVLEHGYIFLRLMQVHPHYLKEMRQRGDANALAKPTIEHYLKLDKSVFIEYVRKRFPDGSNNWTYKMKYNRLGIDLIRVKGMFSTDEQKAAALKEKYHEMEVDADNIDTAAEEELPFPVFKSN